MLLHLLAVVSFLVLAPVASAQNWLRVQFQPAMEHLNYGAWSCTVLPPAQSFQYSFVCGQDVWLQSDGAKEPTWTGSFLTHFHSMSGASTNYVVNCAGGDSHAGILTVTEYSSTLYHCTVNFDAGGGRMIRKNDGGGSNPCLGQWSFYVTKGGQLATPSGIAAYQLSGTPPVPLAAFHTGWYVSITVALEGGGEGGEPPPTGMDYDNVGDRLDGLDADYWAPEMPKTYPAWRAVVPLNSLRIIPEVPLHNQDIVMDAEWYIKSEAKVWLDALMIVMTMCYAGLGILNELKKGGPT